MPKGVYKRSKEQLLRVANINKKPRIDGLRICNYCQVTEDLVKFYSRKIRNKTYHASICILCHKENSSLYYEKHRLKRNINSKRWYTENKEYVNKVLAKKNRDKNREKYNKYMREYQAKNKELKPVKPRKLRLTQIFKISGKKNNRHPWALGFGRFTKPSNPSRWASLPVV